MPSSALRGVLPVFQTPFDEDENIVLGELESEIAWIAEQGAHGVVFGMVSEALRLSDQERDIVIDTVSNAAEDHGLPFVASVGAESTRTALQRLESAVTAGVHAVMVTPPLCGRFPETQLEAHFRTILQHSPVPVVVQDASAYVGAPLSIPLQVRLFEEFGSHVKFKPEAVPVAPVVEALVLATGGQADVFEGMGGASLFETHAVGAVGSMPGADVCWAVISLWEALESEDLVRAEGISAALIRLSSLERDLDSFVVSEKYLLVEQGVMKSQTARAPLSFALDSQGRAALRQLVEDLRGVTARRESSTTHAS